jgi:hypothetical protein
MPTSHEPVGALDGACAVLAHGPYGVGMRAMKVDRRDIPDEFIIAIEFARRLLPRQRRGRKTDVSGAALIQISSTPAHVRRRPRDQVQGVRVESEDAKEAGQAAQVALVINVSPFALYDDGAGVATTTRSTFVAAPCSSIVQFVADQEAQP